MAAGTGRDTVDAGGPPDTKGALVANKAYWVAKSFDRAVEDFCKSCAGFRRETPKQAQLYHGRVRY